MRLNAIEVLVKVKISIVYHIPIMPFHMTIRLKIFLCLGIEKHTVSFTRMFSVMIEYITKNLELIMAVNGWLVEINLMII